MLTNAQNFEDVILQRLFEGQDTGFYVDIGACDPDYLSVTKHFYDRGWSGVNVEPIESQWHKFNKQRTRDVNIHAAIAAHAGKVLLTVVQDNLALSSTITDWRFANRGSAENYLQVEVNAITANQLFEAHVAQAVHFLKIDAEGAEAEILFSLDLQRYRPTVIVVEAVKPLDRFPGWEKFNLSEVANWDKWKPYLLENGYVDAYFDGLNKFFIRDDMVHLVARLELPVGVFDNIVPDIYAQANSAAVEKEAVINSSNITIAELSQEVEELHTKLTAITADNHRLAQLTQSIDNSAAYITPIAEGVQAEIEDLKRLLDKKDCVIAEKQVELVDKETVIICLTKALTAYRVALLKGDQQRYRRSQHSRILQRLKSIFRPRLGNLNQYAPRKLTNLPSVQQASLPHYPKISVITPSYGQAKFIERTMLSVLGQGYPNVEYFVQDGGSIDGTAEVLRAYEGRLAGWASEVDSGQSQAINRGFARATGEIMAWLNSDDLLLPGSLVRVADYFNRHPEVDVVYGDRLLIDENDMEIGRWLLPKHDDRILDWVDYIPQETLFWRRRIWDKIGGSIDESFRFAMDWNLLVRFKAAGARFTHIPHFMGAFRIHPHQKTSAVIHVIGHEEMTRIRVDQLGSIPSHTDIARAILPYMVKHIVVDMIYRVKSRFGMQL